MVVTFVEVFSKIMVYYDILLFNSIYYVLIICCFPYFIRVFSLSFRSLDACGGMKGLVAGSWLWGG